MKISYAITVCNELQELQRLLGFLRTHIRPVDEIVILQDTKTYTKVEKAVFDYCTSLGDVVRYLHGPFNGNFGEWKNKLNSLCTGDYIFQLDADEYLDGQFLDFLPSILEMNPSTELYWVPRINTVEGLTEEDIQRWHWRVNEHGWVNWPDYQGRIYKNKPELRWEGKVHEKIVGAKLYSFLPDNLHLYHPKSIDKQRQQNSLYDQLQRR